MLLVSSTFTDELDVNVPNAARMYDYLIGGKDHFDADRKAADQLLSLVPAVRRQARENRGFLRRAVRHLAAEGIEQFLDLGAGLPARDAVHEVAREVRPGARVAYVDHDPMVVLHGNVLLTEPARSIAVRGDARDPAAILADPAIASHLDFRRPVAVILASVLHYVGDASDPYGIVAAYRDALAPGSCLVLSHITRDNVPGGVTAARGSAARSNAARGSVARANAARAVDRTARAAQALRLYDDARAPVTPRSHEAVTRFFDGFEILRPGIVHDSEWRPDGLGDLKNPPRLGWAGVGRKH